MRIIGSSENIIRGGFIKIRQFQEMGNRDVLMASLISGIYSLVDS